ncbi:MAG: GTPase HflX, partial [Planctomycetota bacterium]|nr:GTPase HflX [Planctomycetota bacterium]
MDELRRLAQAAGADVQGSVVQRLNRPDPATYVGSGKAEEIALKAREVSADVIISGNNLSPAHVRNLENITNTKVVDRTELILDIFARRAMSRQAKLQVEMAQLQYSLPRLRRKWTHLSRIEGGIGLRGPGEKQLEVDRRLAQKRISDLRRSLEQIRKRKEREVTERSNQNTVSLVGYTNAGKSSLLNTLTGANVYTSDT